MGRRRGLRPRTSCVPFYTEYGLLLKAPLPIYQPSEEWRAKGDARERAKEARPGDRAADVVGRRGRERRGDARVRAVAYTRNAPEWIVGRALRAMRDRDLDIRIAHYRRIQANMRDAIDALWMADR